MRASLHSIVDNRFSCTACLSTYAGRADATTMTDALRKTKACYGGSVRLHSIEETDGRKMHFSTCIGNWTKPGWNHWLELHGAYERGLLPYPGSLSDQPNKAIEIFRVIGAWKSERQRVAAEELAQKQQAGARKKGKRRGGQ